MSWGPIVEIVVGLAALLIGAEMVVWSSTRIAAALGVRPLMIGLTIVAIGTSAPELAVGIAASLRGTGSLAVGNIAGTNILNILFILGISAWMKPIHLHLQLIKLELPIMVIVALAFLAMAWDGMLSRAEGITLLVVGIFYTVALVRMSRRESPAVKAEFANQYERPAGLGGILAGTKTMIILLLGFAVIVYGADVLVEGASALARALGVTETIIGLTIVAVGTSAPELATMVVSTLRSERDIAIGNLVGSSIYNLCIILGLTCIIAPQGIPVEQELIVIDIPLMVATALLCIPVFMTGRGISRMEGAGFVCAYLAYMTWLVFVRA